MHDRTTGVPSFRSAGAVNLSRGNVTDRPWGVTLAPAFFGEFSHAVIVGNFGNGTPRLPRRGTRTVMASLYGSVIARARIGGP